MLCLYPNDRAPIPGLKRIKNFISAGQNIYCPTAPKSGGNRYRKELRVTFMKGLRDSTFTFLGLYSMDHQLSDTNRIVWQRVAEECDLTHLDYLEQLRR